MKFIHSLNLARGLSFALLLLLFVPEQVQAQCGSNTRTGASCTRSNVYDTQYNADLGCGSYRVISNYSPGEYFRMPVLQGGCYTIQTCGSSIDTQISCFQAFATTGPYAFNDDNGPACSGTRASVIITPNFTDYTRVDVRQYNCRPGGTSSITVRIRQNNNLSITSSAANMCQGQTRTLTATPARTATAPLTGSGNRGTFSGIGVSGTTFTAPTPSGANQLYTITYTFGYCTRTQNIRVYRNPTTANAGPNQTVTVNSANTAANNPSIGTGTWQVISGSGSFANVNDPTTVVSGLSPGTNRFRWRITNGPCSASTDDVFITFNPDNQAPTVTCPTTQNATFNSNCQFAIPDYRSLVTITDNIDPNPTLTQSPAPGSVVTGSGNNVTQFITMTGTDNSGNSASCSFGVTIRDVTAPSISCPGAQTGTLNSNCQFSVPDYRNSTTVSDNCTSGSNITRTQVPTPGSLIGSSTTVTITATDQAGNSRNCSFPLNLSDNTAPNAVCRNVTVQLNSGGSASISTSQVNNGSSDNCTSSGNLTLSVSPSSFDCSDLGNNSVTLTVTDQAGNSSTCSATVTVRDNISPSISCPSNQTINLNSSCAATVPNFIGATSASDNCPGVSISQSPAPGTAISAPGNTTITMTATDGAGNTNSCTFTLTALDVTNPSVNCPGTQTVSLNASCAVSVPDYRNLVTTSDACSGSISLSQSPTPGTVVSGTGTTAITITATDGGGNTANCSFNMVRQDNTAPTATCRNLTVQLNGSGNASITAGQINNGSSDNCTAAGSLNLSASPSTFDCSDVGNNSVTLTVTDQAGNSSTCTGTVTIQDNTVPTISCPGNQQISVNSSCSAVLPNFTNSASTNDNCSNVSVSQSPPSGTTLSGTGTTPVTLTATDIGGNTATCTFNVTRIDNIPPTVNCPGIQTLNLNASCSANLPDYRNLVGALDNCPGIINLVQSPAPGTSVSGVGTTVVTVTGTDVSGNSSSCSFNVNRSDVTPPTANCQDITVQLSSSGTVSITAGMVNNGSTDNCSNASNLTLAVSPSNFDCDDAGSNTVTLTVTDQAGNSTTCTSNVLVEDNIQPSVVCVPATVFLNGAGSGSLSPSDVNGGASDNCGIQSQAVTPNSFNCSNVGANPVTLVVTDSTGNNSSCNTTVTVSDTISPVANCNDLTVHVDQSGIVFLTGAQIGAGSSDACGPLTFTPASTFFSCGSLGTNNFNLTVEDANGNTSNCSSNITVLDTIPPTAVCQNVTVQLDGSGNASISAGMVDGGSSDNCTINSTTVTPSSFSCSNVGANTVILTVSDGSGNSSTCTATVTVVDTVAPVASCQNTTIYIDGSGTATIAPAAVNNGSTDGCGIASLSLSQTSFNCASTGANPVTLTVTDSNGNTTTCTSVVTVIDSTAPTAVCQDVTVQLNASGTGSIAASQVNNGSGDNCSVASVSVTPSTFNCTSTGANTATLTVTDPSGNSATCTATITAADTVPPTAVCQDITVQLDAAGDASIVAADIDGGSSDACNVTTLNVTPTTFQCVDVGTNLVTLTAGDASGNSATCTANVTVVDTVPPTAVCQDITVQLDGGGDALISPADVDGGTSDACGIDSLVINNKDFNCGDVGANSVVLTATDVNGNVATCTAQVTVEDSVPPTAVCRDVTVQLDGTGNGSVTAGQIDNGSSDNCTVSTVTVAPSNFTCADAGANTVTLTVNDVNGNTSTCTGTVSVQDNVVPTAVCQDITVQLDGSGNAGIIAADVDGGSSDACGIATLSVNNSGFSCSDVGSNSVTLTVTDVFGNNASCTSFVTVQDTVSPNAVCQDVTVQLNGSGQAQIVAADVDGGTSDACGINSLSVTPDTFSCSAAGSNTATLTAVDNNGNSSTCTATITVSDTVLPTAVCNDITVQLDGAGTASITAGMVDGGSSDNCAIASLAVNPNTFNCSSVGANTVTLTVTDINGNTSTCTSTAFIEDTLPPVAVCQNITVQLSGSGTASIVAGDVDGGSSDICGIGNLSINNSSFSCADVGANTVVLTATDVNGNSASCTANVAVVDTVPPTAVCQDVTVQLDGNGTATVSAASINNGSSDACGINSLSVVPDTFSCANLGANTVTLTVTDNNSNSSTCTATVIVEDNTAPVAVCQTNPVTVQLDTAGTGILDPADIDNGSTDNCTVANLSVSQSVYNCGDLGTNGVTLTVTDQSGNSSTCSGTVFVSDTVSPQLVNCPADQTVGNTPQNCGAIVFWSAPSATDNCNTASITSTSNSGSLFQVGTTTVVYTATDGSGNTDVCSFDITVIDNQPPVINNCPANIVQTNDPGQCGANVSWAPPVPSDNCPSVTMTGSANPGSFFNVGTTVVTYIAVDQSNNSDTCSFTVTVNDNENPDLACPANTIASTDSSSCAALVTGLVATVTDNCALDSVYNTQTGSGSDASGVYPLGTTSVTVFGEDIAGNMDSCSFAVQVIDNVDPVINCPANVTVSSDSNLCSAVVSGLVATASDKCGILSLTNDFTSGGGSANGTYPLGVTTVTFTATDSSGNTSDCAVTVTVEDNTDPVISCPANIAVNTAPGQCGANVTWPTVVASDNCGLQGISSTANSGDFFATGTTTVSYTATDLSGNTATCSFTVTVNDSEAPTVTCPFPVTASNTPGQCGANASWIPATINDNCGIASSSSTANPGDLFPVGTTTVTYTATDSAGNSDSCSFTVTIQDTEDPDLTCPASVSVGSDSSQCGTNVAGLTATASDNCGIASLVNDQNNTSDASGFYPVGTTTVVFTATDSAGNDETCSFTVTVSDDDAPVLTCPADVVVSNIPGSCSGTATWSPATATDNCAANPTVIQTGGPNPGSIFPVGSTTITYTALDNAGNNSTCSFQVIVEDTEDPVLSCPANIVVDSDPGQCDAVVNFNVPVGTDNCPGVATAQTDSTGLTTGSTFPRGTTVLSYQSTDAAGNTDACFFTITVEDNEAPVLACPSNTVLDADSNQCGTVHTYPAPSATDNCTASPTVVQTGGIPSGGNYPVGVTMNQYIASDLAGNTDTCMWTVEVNDVTPPTLVCPADVSVNNDTGICGAQVNGLTAASSDNCGVIGLTNSFNGTADASGLYPVGTTTVAFTATDSSGNASTCDFDVTVLDAEAPVISCPANISVGTDPGQCSATVSWPMVTATDNCGVDTILGSASSGATFPVGTTVVNYLAADTSGNTDTCSFAVTVTDNEPPVISCPTNLVVSNQPGQCGANVTWSMVTATDNCGIDSIVGSAASGDFFPVGVSTVNYLATDLSGNTDTCSFTVTVNDTELPQVTCPPGMVMDNDTGQCGATATWAAVVATDNCVLDTVIGTAASGDFFPVGTTLVTFTATDTAGNSANCDFSVTVNDNEAPVVNCPADTVFSNDPGACEAIVTWASPTSSDNCGVVSGTTNVPNGNNLPVGTTTITYTATDSTGNSTSCSFDVTVEDNEAPVIVNCSPDIVQDNDPGQCSALVSWAPITASDNCQLDTLVSNFESDDIFPVGVTQVVYIATDIYGNADTCTFTVTVLDIDDPVITCPANIVQANDTGSCGAIVSYNVTATDQCGVDSIVCSNNSGDFFPVGTTLVSCIATDTSGNSDNCSFTVTVNDNEAPAIVCPADVIVANDTGQCAAVVAFASATATENCNISSIASNISSGSTFQVGTTPVTFTATDSAGNSSSCTFNVTVNDTEAPTIACPADIAVANDTGQCAAMVMWPMVQTSDNCGVDSVSSTSNSGDVFPVGTTPVFYQVTDLSGNTDTCSFNITVNDTENPIVICPANIVVSNDTGQCAAVVTWAPVFTSDNCGIDTLVSSHVSGDTFAVGTTTVNYFVGDAAGNVGQCSFDVTVEDTEAPVVICPADLVVSNDSNQCGAIVNYPAATTSDNCGVVSVQSTPPAGSSFPVGTTPVTVVVDDAAGNSSSCVFNVTVNDTEAPEIACPADIVVSNDAGQCAAQVNWPSVQANDNCGIDTVVSSAMNGDTFQVGTTTIFYQVDDLSGNTDTCSFTITVNDTDAPVVTCPANIIVPNDTGQCAAVVTWPMVQTSDNCGVDTLVGSSNSGDVFPVGMATVSYLVTDIAGNSDTCSFTVTVEDTEAPVIVCPSDIFVNNDTGQCAATVTFPNASASDNCGIASVQSTPASGSSFPVGTTLVTFTATDSAGNSSTCTFNVTVSDNEAPQVICPADRVVGNDPGQCAAQVSWPMVQANDNCGIDSLVGSAMSGDTFAVGSHVVNYLATDLSGNTDSCSFTITVNDTEAPVVVCPADIVISNDTGQCAAVATWPMVQLSDNCSIDTVLSTAVSGDTFPVGTTQVTYVVADDTGNGDTCSFNVTVNDAEAPVVTCPAAIIVSNDSNQCQAVVNWPMVTATDNCGLDTIVGTASSGMSFPVGVTPVTFTATDLAGNADTCGFTVTVNDTEAPTVICPADLTVSNDTGQCAAVVTFPTASAADNCGISSVVPDFPSGSTFPVGTTLVTFTATDSAGNSTSCDFNIAVNDTEAPTVVCPANTTVSNDPGQCVAVVNWAPVQANDNCGIAGINSTAMSGDTFAVGMTVVTYAVVDSSGNGDTCSFTVTVNDTEVPVVTCPTNITVSNDPGTCAAVVTWPMVSAVDNCAIDTVIGTAMSGDTFGVGTTTIDFVAVDVAGNADSCSFTVTVNDTEAPVIACPANVTVANDSGQCGAAVTWNPVTASDNCGIDTVMGTAMSGATFPVGTTVVGYMATDLSGNVDSCSFMVTVNDTELPTLACPADTTYLADTATCAAVANWTPVVFADNCGIDSTWSNIQPGTSLPVGTVNISYYASDPSGNLDSCDFDVTVTAAPLQIAASSPLLSCGYNITCAGANNGSVDVAIQGGCGPYQVLWNNGGTTTNQQNLGTGTYSVTVTDGQGTVLTDTVTLTQPDLLTAFVIGDTAVCDGDSTALLDLVVNGGNDCEPYDYLWSTGDTTAQLVGLSAGSYGVTVTDVNGCFRSDSVVIDSRPLPVVDLGPDTTVCPGTQVTLDAGAGFASYDWTTGDSTPSIVVNAIGSFGVTVVDSFGCEGSGEIELNSFITADTIITPRTGLFVCRDDSLELTAAAGFSSYLWNTGSTTSTTFAMNPGGLYTVTATDSNGCSVTDSVFVDFKDIANPTPVILPGNQITLCAGDIVTLDAQGGYFSYEWSTGQTTQTVKASTSGQFNVTVTNGFGCIGVSDTVTVTEVPLPTPSIALQNDTLFTIGTYTTYQWNKDGVLIPGAIIDFFVPQTAGWYSVAVTDGNGCSGVSDSIFIDPSVSAEGATEELLGVDLYPNPTSGILNVRTYSPINWDVDLTVMDMYGHIAKTFHLGQLQDTTELDLTDLANGMYLLKIEDKKGRAKMIRFMIE